MSDEHAAEGQGAWCPSCRTFYQLWIGGTLAFCPICEREVVLSYTEPVPSVVPGPQETTLDTLRAQLSCVELHTAQLGRYLLALRVRVDALLEAQGITFPKPSEIRDETDADDDD
jgi:hypothetical protein